MLTDPLADFLTRIRNASGLKKEKVEVPHSKVKEAIVRVLKREGFIRDFRVMEEGKKKIILELKYGPRGEPIISGLERVSAPGRRVYVKREKIPRVLNGLGICILSTPKGILSGEEAKKMGVGGEILCKVW